MKSYLLRLAGCEEGPYSESQIAQMFVDQQVNRSLLFIETSQVFLSESGCKLDGFKPSSPRIGGWSERDAQKNAFCNLDRFKRSSLESRSEIKTIVDHSPMKSYLLKLSGREGGLYSESQIAQMFVDQQVNRSTPCKLESGGDRKAKLLHRKARVALSPTGAANLTALSRQV